MNIDVCIYKYMYVDITSVSHAYVHMFDARNRIASWLKRAALPHRQHTPCRQSPAPCEDCCFCDSFDTSGVGYQEVRGVAVSLAANGMCPICIPSKSAHGLPSSQGLGFPLQ